MERVLTGSTAPAEEGTAADQEAGQVVQAAEETELTEQEKELIKSLEEQRKQIEKEKEELKQAYLRLDTKQLLKENGLPEILADYVMASDFDRTKEVVAEIRKVLDIAVQQQVVARLAGKTPQAGTGSSHAVGSITAQVKRSLE